MATDTQRGIQNVCLMILAAVAVGFVLVWFRSVLIPFVLAVFVAYGLAPVIEIQTSRLRVPRPLAVLMTLLLGIVLLSTAGGLVSTSIQQLSENADSYQAQIEQTVEKVLDSPLVATLAPGFADELNFREIVPTRQLGAVLLGTTNAIVDLLSKGLIVLVFLFFLLSGESAVRSRGVRAEVEAKIRRYIVIQGALSAATGILVGGILALLGVPLAMVFGLFAFLLNFIPNVGSAIATLLPLPVVLMNPEISSGVAVLAILLPALVQFTIGNVISPKVMGDSLELHPVTILLALMVWGALWGVVGMLLATPITSVLKMLLERMPLTQPLARLMAGHFEPRPA
ncbi:MAG: AI-2E family transporter [Myxococcota bacterium]|nr:AI-2E family transporter [Myxococcota bacterium]